MIATFRQGEGKQEQMKQLLPVRRRKPVGIPERSHEERSEQLGLTWPRYYRGRQPELGPLVRTAPEGWRRQKPDSETLLGKTTMQERGQTPLPCSKDVAEAPDSPSPSFSVDSRGTLVFLLSDEEPLSSP